MSDDSSRAPIDESESESDVESESDGATWNAARLAQASYKDLGSPAHVEERFARHVRRHCKADLHQLLSESSATTRDYSVCIDTFDLMQADPVLAILLIRYPATLLSLLESAIVRAQYELVQQREEEHTDHAAANVVPWQIKGAMKNGDGGENGNNTRVHARLVHLPPTCCKPSLGRCLAASDVGKIWQVSGTVVRTGSVQMVESARMYQCSGVNLSSNKYRSGGSGGSWRGGRGGGRGGPTNSEESTARTSADAQQAKTYCGRTFLVHADVEQRNNALQEPESCPGTLPNGDRCPGNKFTVVEGGSVHTDYQEMKIQDAATSSSGGGGIGHIPRSLLVKLQHDLVDNCQPGDEVVVVGILLAQWQQPGIAEGMECQVSMVMLAHSVRVICEKGSSVWKEGGGSSSNKGSGNSIGERDQFAKEFTQFWAIPINVRDSIAARDFICKAICPKLYGMHVIKLALLLTLIGGVSSDVYEDRGSGPDDMNGNGGLAALPTDFPMCNEPNPFRLFRELPSKKPTTAYYDNPVTSFQERATNSNETVKTRRRDQSHLLLVGDPGTGKSQFLRFAAALCPRSVMTTGVGTTSAGLTCAAVREGSGKEFALEAGALVLADKGVCCIDEFGCIRESDRTSIHEAMEQQTLSVAKAGIVCKLNCRATIIAVMNPRDCLYDNHSSLAVNTGLGTPLLSRFDLIFKLVDSSDAERDSNVTTYLLNRAIQGAGFDVTEAACESGRQINEIPWTMEKLRAYISVVKDRFQPVMSDDAAMLLGRHYEKCRSAQCITIPVTVRFLESLIRLSQAHSRLMHRENNNVTLQDAVAVIQVMESSAFAYGGFDGMGVDDVQNALYCDPMTIDFSTEPELDFLCFEYRILERYDMLDRMESIRKDLALSSLGADDTGDVNAWHDLETNQYNRDNILNRNTGDQSSGAFSQRSVTQDHYGRFHFGSTQSNKRSRR